MSSKYLYTVLIFHLMFIWGCKKIIQISPPVGQISSSQVFSTDDQALSAVAGLYYNMVNMYKGFSGGGITAFAGMSADELIPYDQNVNSGYIFFLDNDLPNNSGLIYNNIWVNVYSTIYGINAVLEGLNSYSGVNDSLKNELIGEVEFLRAYCNFYLVNLFGDIPLVTTINWHKTGTLSRTPSSLIYEAIIADLLDAQMRLPIDYSFGNGQRILPNKWAATALLARAYLFTKDWKNAIAQSSSVINITNLYGLDSINDIFLTNSNEAIWQLQQSLQNSPFSATPEGALFIPGVLNSNDPPFQFLTPTLLNSFEIGDQRKKSWIDSTSYNNVEYYFPYKYKIGIGQVTSNYVEYYMMLRLAEQYLIRAEAETEIMDLTNAASDLNVIRNRAGLNSVTISDQSKLLNSIYHEWQVEFMFEWGHRWLDLKRWGIAVQILTTNKESTVTSNSLLYPIPISELKTDPNLTQNPGY